MDFDRSVEHGYADSNGVKIHYAALGDGPLIVFVHGFPDFWYTWRHQMRALCDRFRCVAMDTRGYNLSDKPKGVEHYKLSTLGDDVLSVIRHFGCERAIVCGHDYGGSTAWRLALRHPDRVEKLMILNLPHPKGFSREIANNPAQQAASQYIHVFQDADAHEKLNAQELANWVTDPEARARYVEAFERSDFEAMLNYYKHSFVRKPYQEIPELPKIAMPVLMFHGLDDTALLSDALNNTWDWIDRDLTLITIPHAGHFVQQDAADLVSRSMRMWLLRDEL